MKRTHFSSTKVYGVPLLRHHQDVPPPGGAHRHALGDAVSVPRLRHLLPVVVEVGQVQMLSVNTGPHAEADPPGPRYRHNKDAFK